MGFNDEPFEVEITDECILEMTEIYDYISNELKEDKSAETLMTEVTDKILNLPELPELYMKIGTTDDLKRDYHRMVVKNYVVLYTIDLKKRTIYISHMVYKGKNYLRQ